MTKKSFLIPLISILLGLSVGAVIMLFFGYNPLEGYQTMFSSAFLRPTTYELNAKSIGEIFVGAAPLIFTGLAFSVAYTAGFFNIGLSGQALCGWVASLWIALSLPDFPKIVVVPLAVVAGALAGALAGAIPGLLRAFFGTSEVIVTIMLNYIFLYISTHLVNNVMPQSFITNKGTTHVVGNNGSLRTSWLGAISEGSRLNIGIFLALFFLVFIWYLMKKTTLGYEIRSVGFNSFAAEYAGMNSKRIIVTSMMISGMLAGLGGVVQGLGTFGNFFVQNTSLSIGFDGIAVSLLGQGSAFGILLASFLFSILKLGGKGMQSAGIPTELVDVVIGAIIYFIAIKYLIEIVVNNFHKKKQKGELG